MSHTPRRSRHGRDTDTPRAAPCGARGRASGGERCARWFDSGMEYALAVMRQKARQRSGRGADRYPHSRRRARCDEVAWVIRELNSKTILEET